MFHLAQGVYLIIFTWTRSLFVIGLLIETEVTINVLI